MRGIVCSLLSLLLCACPVLLVRAADPPHDSAHGMDCDSCHSTPLSGLAIITTSEGNASHCLGCHSLGGVPMNKALHRAGQAMPGTSGTSHRWDTSCLAYVRLVSPVKNVGKVGVYGAWTSDQATTYTCTITSAGNVDEAVVEWTNTLGGSGSYNTEDRVPLDNGLGLTFADHPTTTSFPLGMTFNVFVEPLGTPSPRAVADYIMDGKVVCSTCHDQHSNTHSPFLRVSNEGSALCESCHANRAKGVWRDDPADNVGHHPTGVTLPESPWFRTGIAPLVLEESTNAVECLTCHAAHHADSDTDGNPAAVGRGDGKLLRMAGDSGLCQTCHLYSGHNGADCLDCHQPHGTENIKLVRNAVDAKPVELGSLDAGAMARGGPLFDGVCEICHEATAYHRGNASGDHSHFATRACTSCHVHRNGFSPRNNDCLACHSTEQNTTADGLARRAIGSEFESATGHHPFTYNYGGDLSNPQDNNCLICHLEDSYDDALHGNEAVDLDPDPDGSGLTEWQTYPGTLHEWCVDCHDGDNPNPASRLSGLIASDKSDMAVASTHRADYPNGGAVFAGLCTSCHQNGHTARVKFFSYFAGDGTEELTCYGCHGMAANVSYSGRYMENLKVAYVGTGAVPPRSSHAEAEGVIGDGQVLCRQCHNPHRLDHGDNLVCDPDVPDTNWGGPVDNAWCLTCHDESRAASPVHLDISINGRDCQTCHLPHASTNEDLLLIAELSGLSVQLAPNPASVPLDEFQQFQPALTPPVDYLTTSGLQKHAAWAIEGISGGSGGAIHRVEANIPLDRTVGYDPSGWGLISVTSTTQVTTGPLNVEDINVFVDVPHHYRGDLELWLRNLTTGEEAQFVQANWSDGAQNLIKVFNSESPNSPGSDVTANPANAGTGIVEGFVSRDGYTGPLNLVYTFTITVQGDVGAARFDWSDSTGGSGTNVLTSSTPIALGSGAEVAFYNLHPFYGGVSPQFKVGDSWTYPPMRNWDTRPDSFTVFNDRNSNGSWEMELHDTWPTDNPTDPESPDFCFWRSWSLLINSGVLGTMDDMGLFRALYDGTGRVYSTWHHGKIWPVQSGLSDFVYEDPLPISASVELVTGSGRGAPGNKALEGPRSPGREEAVIREAMAFQRGNRMRGKAAMIGMEPHSREILAVRACGNCHGQK